MGKSIPKYIGEEIELGHHVIDSKSEDPAIDAGVALTAAHHDLYGSAGEELDLSLKEFDTDSHRFYLDHGHCEADSPLVASSYDLVLSQRKIREKFSDARRPQKRRPVPFASILTTPIAVV